MKLNFLTKVRIQNVQQNSIPKNIAKKTLISITILQKIETRDFLLVFRTFKNLVEILMQVMSNWVHRK